MAEEFALDCQRHRFAIPRDIAYLNCAYMSPLSHDVVAAMHTGAQSKATPWTYRSADFFTVADAARTAYARVFGAAADDIAIVPSASYGLAIAAANVAVAAGQDIVLLGDQFPSNVYIWREKAKACGARIVHTARDADSDWTAGVLDAIGPQTAVVAVPQCHWADGGLVDLVAVGAACRKVGAALVLDLTQSLGALPFDVAAVDPDFGVVAGYKWLMCPYGTGALYVARRHQNGTSIEQPWMGRRGADDFARLVEYQDDYAVGARRFDMGGKSNPALLLGVVAALAMIQTWGIARIAATLAVRNASLADRAAKLGYAALPAAARAGHFLALALPGNADANALPARLAEAGVYVSVRGQSLRVTQHLYNDDVDCDRLIAAL